MMTLEKKIMKLAEIKLKIYLKKWGPDKKATLQLWDLLSKCGWLNAKFKLPTGFLLYGTLCVGEKLALDRLFVSGSKIFFFFTSWKKQYVISLIVFPFFSNRYIFPYSIKLALPTDYRCSIKWSKHINIMSYTIFNVFDIINNFIF